MFNFFKKDKVSDEKIPLILNTDMHSHILPGIDDGSPDIPTSLVLVQGLYDLGYRRLIATPHVFGDMYKNNFETISNALQQLKTACYASKINIELFAAAEYMLDDYFLDILKKKEQILSLHKNYILTELPYSVKPMNVAEMVFDIITAGYKPILAHPERYFYYHNDYDEYYKLKELGFTLQVNLLSLTGYYGPLVTKAAKFILEKNLSHFAGTDLHHARHLAALNKNENIKIINKYLSNKLYNDFASL